MTMPVGVYRETAGIEMQVSYRPWGANSQAQKEHSTAMLNAFVAVDGRPVRYRGMWIDVEYTGFITVSFTDMHPDDYDQLNEAFITGDSDPGYVTLVVSRIEFVERGRVFVYPPLREWEEALRLQQRMTDTGTHPAGEMHGRLAF